MGLVFNARTSAIEVPGSELLFSNKAVFPASTTSVASLNMPHGTAPSSPVNGDVWTTSSSIYARINGVTQDLLASSGSAVISGTPVNNQLAVWTNATTIEGDANLTWDGSSLGITGAFSASGQVSAGSIDVVSASAAIQYYRDTGAGAGLKNYRIAIDDGSFSIRSMTDALADVEYPFYCIMNASSEITQVQINGDEVELNAATLDFNGAADISGTLSVGETLNVNTGAGSAQAMRVIGADTIGDCYIGFYESDGTTRKAYVGFGNGADDQFHIVNEEAANSPDVRLSAGTNGTVFIQTDAAATTVASFNETLVYSSTKDFIVGKTTASVHSVASRGVVAVNGATTSLFGLEIAGVDQGYVYASGGLLTINSSVGNLNLSCSSGTVTIAGSTAWHAGNDGTGSGLDADLLDGYHAGPTSTYAANTLARYDPSGYLFSLYFNQASSNSENPTVDQIMVTNGSDGYFRKASLAHLGSSLGFLRNTGTFTYGGFYLAAEADGGYYGLTIQDGSNITPTLMSSGSSAGIYMQTVGQWIIYWSSSVVNIPYSVSVTGSVTATGDGTFNTSDIRFKTNLEKIDGALDKVVALNGYTFNKKHTIDGEYEEFRRAGIVAQEVEQVLPEAIMEKDGYKFVSDASLTPLLIEAVKELSAKVKLLEGKLEELQNGT